MTVTIPRSELLNPIHVRILSADRWGLPWEERRYWSRNRGGYELLDCERVALPAIGQATIRYRFGQYITRDGITVVGQNDLPDLTGKLVRIQAAEVLDRPASDSGWTDIWLGGCEYYQDTGWPAATIPAGERTFHCIDLWAFFSRKWVNRTHAFRGVGRTGDPLTVAEAIGNPGYNVASGGTLGGNKSSAAGFLRDGLTVKYFCWPDASDAEAWNDKEVIENQIALNKQIGDPAFSFKAGDSFELLEGQAGTDGLGAAHSAWPITDGEMVWNVVNRICDRKRGRGLVFFDWDVAGDTITPYLRVFPQSAQDIVVPLPSGGSLTIPGSDTFGSTTTYDLQGDHRCIEGAFKLGARNHTAVDYLETISERIEIMMTLEYTDAGEPDSLEERWDTTTEQADFLAASAAVRKELRWRSVYSLHGVPGNWDLIAADGNGSAEAGIWWRCDDEGALRLDAAPNMSPSDITWSRDLPIFSGYKYSVDPPVRYDGKDDFEPARQPMKVWIRTGNGEFVELGKIQGNSLQFRLGRQGWWVENAGDHTTGNRFIGDTTESIGSSYDYWDVVLTVSAQLPHRVRMASGSEAGSRRKVIYVPGLHLWLAHQGAIWTVESDKSAKRMDFSGAGTVRVLRDDRNALALIHSLAWEWYRQTRRNAQFGLRCCGMLQSFQAVVTDGTTATVNKAAESVVYPYLGDHISRLKANGQSHELNTPVTRVRYDHQQLATTWSTDWAELDFRR